jgi:hypothetical protein
MNNSGISPRYAVKAAINKLIADFGTPNLSLLDIHQMTKADLNDLPDILIEFHRQGYLTIPDNIRSIDKSCRCIQINTYIETCPFGDDFKTPANPKYAVPQEWPLTGRPKNLTT